MEGEYVRHCANCKTEIHLCNGFVNAGDFVLAFAGKLDWKKVRELCGRCVFIWEMSDPLLGQDLRDLKERLAAICEAIKDQPSAQS